MSPFLSSNNCGIKDTSVLRSSGVDWCSIAFNFSIIFQLLKLLWVSIKYLKNVALFSLFINGDVALMEHKIVVNYFCVILTYFIVILNKTCRPDTSCLDIRHNLVLSSPLFTQKVIEQGYVTPTLKSSLWEFYGRLIITNWLIVRRYQVSISQMTMIFYPSCKVFPLITNKTFTTDFTIWVTRWV